MKEKESLCRQMEGNGLIYSIFNGFLVFFSKNTGRYWIFLSRSFCVTLQDNLNLLWMTK